MLGREATLLRLADCLKGLRRSLDSVSSLQGWTAKLVTLMWGDKAMHPRERLFRFSEEAFEVMQAGGMTEDDVLAMFKSVYRKEKGDFKQELSGASITLFALCHAHKQHVGEIVVAEWERVEANYDVCKDKDKHKIHGFDNREGD